MRSSVRAWVRVPARALLATTLLATGLVWLTRTAASAAPTPLSNPILEAVPGTASTVATTSVANCDGSVTPPARPGPVTMSYGSGTQYRLASYTANGQDFQVLPIGVGESYVDLRPAGRLRR